jgi:hypothetical protein
MTLKQYHPVSEDAIDMYKLKQSVSFKIKARQGKAIILVPSRADLDSLEANHGL